MATIKDVALLSNVSYSTVSIVLSGKAKERKISEETQRRVLEAAQQLHYVPNIAAKQLKSPSQKRFSIAVFWPSDYRMSFIIRFFDGINRATPYLGDPIDIIVCPYQVDHLSDHAELFERGIYHGILIASTGHEDLAFLENNTFPIPIVLLNRSSEKYSTVGTDNYKAGKMAADYLISCGFKDIAAVSSQANFIAMNDHRSGFENTWDSIVGTALKRFSCHNSILGGYNVAKEILNTPLPDAVFFDTDAAARGFLCAAAEYGFKVPDDLSVLAMGVYTPEPSSFTVPPLTTVEIPHELFAQHGLTVLMSIIKGYNKPSHLLFDPILKVRSSCKNITG